MVVLSYAIAASLFSLFAFFLASCLSCKTLARLVLVGRLIVL